MYLLAVLAVVVMSFVTVAVMRSGGNLQYFSEPLSFLMLLVICVLMLLVTGLLKDFNHAFRYLLKKDTDPGLYQMKRSLEAVKFVMKTVVYGTVFFTSVSLVTLLYRIDDISSIGPIMASFLLAIVYGMMVNMVLLAVKVKLQLYIMNFVAEEPEDGAENRQQEAER